MKTKRILSALLAFAMLLSACPDVMFGHVHAADEVATTSGDLIDINGVTLGSYNKLFYWKYIHDNKGNDNSKSNSGYTFPFSLASPQKDSHSQMIVPGSFGDQGKQEFSTQSGKYITRIEFVLLGHYHANGENNGTYYRSNTNPAKYTEMQQLAADMRDPESSKYVKLGDITLKLGTTDSKSTYSSNSDYITTGLTEVKISDFYITPYDHVADGGNGSENDYFDMLVIELETPYYYDGKNIVIDMELGDGWDNFSSQKVSGDNSFYWRDNKNSDTYCLAANGNKIAGRMPRFKINFSDGTPNYTVTNTAGEGELPQVTVKDKNGNALASDTYVAKYVGRGNTVYAETTTVPTDAGDYTMILDFGAANNGYTGTKTVNFTLPEKPVNPDEINAGAYEETTIFFKYEPGDSEETKSGATNIPMNFKSGSAANLHSQMMYPADFFDAGKTSVTIEKQNGKVITKLEFPLSGRYKDGVNNALGNITVKMGTSDRMIQSDGAGDKLHQLTPVWEGASAYYIPDSELTTVFTGKPYITSVDWYDTDVLVIELDTPFMYDAEGEAIIVDIVLNSSCNIESYLVSGSGQSGFEYHTVDSANKKRRLSIASNGTGQNDHPLIRFTFGKENVVVDYDPNEQIYTDKAGNGKRPTINSVYDTINKINLVEGTHYSVYFCDETGTKISGAPAVPGKFQMVLDFDAVTGDDYVGKKVIPFTVQRGFDVTIKINNNNTAYMGEPITPDIEVYDGDTKLVYNTDYYCTYNGGKAIVDAGTYEIVVHQSGSTGAKKTATFTVVKASNSATIEMVGWNWAPDATGSDPVVNATYGIGNKVITYYDAQGKALSGKPTNAGTYTVKVTVPASGNYEGAEASATFTIAPMSLMGTTMVDRYLPAINDGTKPMYNFPMNLLADNGGNNHSQIIVPADDLKDLEGKEITSLTLHMKRLWEDEGLNIPSVTIKIGETDQGSFAYASNNTFIEGLTTVFSGSVSSTGNTLVLKFDQAFPYNGGNLVIDFMDEIPEKDFNCSFLGKEGSSYQGIYSYDGGVTATKFRPKMSFGCKSEEPAVTVTLQGETDLKADGNPLAPGLSAILADGTELAEGTDYTVHYVGVDGTSYDSDEKPTNVGHYKATVTFCGNYTSSYAEEFAFSIYAGDTSLTATLDKWHVGKSHNKPVAVTNSKGNISYQYKPENGNTWMDVDFENASTVPTAPGTYKLKVTVEGTDEFPEKSIEISFTIEDHTIVNVPAQTKTCTQDGWDAYDKCTTSGCGYVSEHEFYAKGHDWETVEAKEANTCGDTYYAAYTACKVCHEEDPNNPKVTHTLGHADNNGDHHCDKCSTLTGTFQTFTVGTMSAPLGHKGIYTGIVNYNREQKDKVILSMGNKEFFRLNEDGSLYLCGYQVEGTYITDTYAIKLNVIRTQKMVEVQVKLPDGTTIRRNTYELLEGNDADSYQITAQAYDTTDVADSKCEQTGMPVADYYQLVETAPTSGNIYNLTTSFNDARYDRAFAWTVQSSWLQSLGATGMAISYSPSYDFTAPFVMVDATQVGEYNGEVYYKVDIPNLQAGTAYCYKIGWKNANGTYEWYMEDGLTKLFEFTTAAEGVNDFTFGVIGDTHANGQWNNSMYTQAAYAALHKVIPGAAFVLHTGDIADSDSAKAAEWNEFFAALGTGDPIALFAASGNHDPRAVSGNNYFYNWHFNNPDNGYLSNPDNLNVGHNSNLYNNMGETFYSFDYGNTHFIVLNSGNYGSTAGDDNLLLAQKAWLIEDLEKNQHAKWTVVMVHQPVYHRYTGSADISRRALHDVFEQYGVDLVIQGHSHLVSRSYPVDASGNFVKNLSNPDSIDQGIGTVYITVGSTATNHDKIDQLNSNNLMLISTPTNEQPAYTTVSVTDGNLVVTIKQLDGLVIDTFTINGTKTEAEVTHTFGETEVITASTCTEKGVGLKKCTVCDYQEYVEIPAVGHAITYVGAQDATCEEIGWDAYEYCGRKDCGYTTYVEIPATGHSEVPDEAKDPTCTEPGKTAGKHCDVCGKKIIPQQEIPAWGHEEDSVVVENKVDPTCTVDGSYDNVIYCKYCPAELSRETVVVTALGHTDSEVKKENVVEPTCTEDGSHDEVIYCTVCGEETSRETVVDEACHTYGEPDFERNDNQLAVKVTCDKCEDGTEDKELYKIVECTVTHTPADNCQTKSTTTYTAEGTLGGKEYNYYKLIEGEKGSHVDNSGWEVDETHHWHKCEVVVEDRWWLDDILCKEEFDKNLHFGGSATCIEKAKCEVCNVAYGELAECNMVAGEVVAPTCSAEGYTVYTCEYGCGKTENRDTVPAAHDLIDVEGQAATCTVDGYTAHKACKREGCDYTEGKEVIPAAHSFVNYAQIGDSDLEQAECENCDATDIKVSDKATGEGDNEVTVVPGASTETSNNVTIGKTVLGNIGNAGHNLHFSGMIDLLFNNAALQTIIDLINDAADASIVVEQKTELPEYAKEGSLLFDISMMIGGELQSSTDFKGGDEDSTAEVTVTIPLGDHLAGKNVKVYWLKSVEGGVEKVDMGGVTNKDKTHVTFKTTHFTEYLVEEQDEVTEPEQPTAPGVTVTKPANGTTINHSIADAENGWTLTLTAEDTTKTYVYLVKYTDANGVVSEKIVNSSGNYRDGNFVIPAGATSVTVESALMGDIFIDGKVDNKDLIRIRQILAGTFTNADELTKLAANVFDNNNIAVDNKDLIRMRQYLAGNASF